MIFLRSIGLNHYHLVLVVNLWSRVNKVGEITRSDITRGAKCGNEHWVRKAFLWLVMAPLVIRVLYFPQLIILRTTRRPSHSLSEFLCSHNADS